MEDRALQDISMRELLVFYYRYRARLMAAFFLPFIVIVALSFLPDARFEAGSVLIVRMGSEYVYQPEVANNKYGPGNAIPFDRDQIFKSEVAILDSDDLHMQVIRAIGLEKLYPRLAETTLFDRISWWSAGLVGDAPTHEQIEQRRYAKALLKFDRRLDIKLEKESAVINVTFEHPDAAIAVAVLDELLKLYLEKRKQLYLEPRLDLAATQLDATHQKALDAERAVDDFKKKHKIYSLPDQRAELLQARSEVDKARATVSSPALEGKIAYYNRELDQLDAQEREFDRLQHEKQIAEDEYAQATHKLNEASAFDELEKERAGSVRIIQPPSAPPEPKPLQLLIILAGFFISLLSVLGMAALTEFLDGGFLTPERLERKTGLPVLAVLSLRD